MTDKFIKIGELSEISGFSVDVLRKWDNSGEYPAAHKTKGGTRFYSPAQVEEIKELKNKGFKLAN